MTMTTMPPELAEWLPWIEATAGERVRDGQRLSVGASRAMFILYTPGGRDLVLRVDTGGGPFAGTCYTLEREAELYHALSPHFAHIPEFLGQHPSGKAFLMNRVQGTHELSTLGDEERVAVCEGLVDALADLHRIDTGQLDLPSFQRPEQPQDHALLELAPWCAMLDQFPQSEVALARAAISILRSSAPRWDGRPVLCHGDLGPKNFMFAHGKVTALIDWELAHLGDPHDDLAWWIFRGHEWLGAAGDLTAQLRRWSERTGLAIDPARLVWYRALVLLRFYILVRTAMLHGGNAPEDRIMFLRLMPLLDVKLSQALASLLGETFEPAPPPAADAPIGAAASAALRSILEGMTASDTSSAETRRSAASATIFVEHLAAIDRLGGDIRRKDDAERYALMGRVGPTPPEEMSREQMIAFLDVTMRHGLRHAHLWPDTLERALAPSWSPDSLGSDER